MDLLGTLTQSIQRASSAFWWEWHRELRRQASDERLPSDVRVRVRESAQRALARSEAARPRPIPFPRRALRDRTRVTRTAAAGDVRTAVTELGLGVDRPFVVFEAGRRGDTLDLARTWLQQHGYEVVLLPMPWDERLSLVLRSSARFLVCESPELQRSAYETGTPTLLLNATEPFAAYPVPGDGVFTLATAVDLDSGDTLSIADRLSERYFRNLRNVGFRPNSAAEVLLAVREVHEGLTNGWRETETQTRFRRLVVDAGASLRPRVPLVAQWGPDEGFIGDGRLARVQADRLPVA